MMRLRSPAVWSSAPPPPPPSCHGNLWVISSPIYWLIFHQTPRHSTVLLAAAATVNWHQPSIMRRARRHLNTKNYSGAWEFCPVQAAVFIVLKWSSLWFVSSSGSHFEFSSSSAPWLVILHTDRPFVRLQWKMENISQILEIRRNVKIIIHFYINIGSRVSALIRLAAGLVGVERFS